MSAAAVVRLDVDERGQVTVDAPAGWLDADQRETLRGALDLIRPTLARVGAPPLPPREAWPPAWREAWTEREAIAAEGGALDPAAVADDDLRAAVARGDLPLDRG